MRGSAIIMALALAAAHPAAGQTVVYVDAGAAGANDGTSWTDAFADLEAALTAASGMTPPVHVWVAAATYLPSIESEPGVPRSRTFALIEGVSLYGGFAGGESSLAERDVEANQTSLSGDFNGDDLPGFVNRGENAYNIITATGLTDATALDGFTIRGGHANGGNETARGGGVHVSNRLSIAQCAFVDCYANYGGGAYAASGLRVEATSFTACRAQSYGGAVRCDAGSSTFLRCRAEANVASSGGAFSVRDATIENCVFVSNVAGEGGAILSAGTTRIVNGVLALNAATSPGSAWGGAVTSIDDFSAHGCVFYGNTVAGFSGNWGGAIAQIGLTGSCDVANSIFWRNDAPFGTQVWSRPGAATVALRHCVVDGGAAGVDAPAALLEMSAVLDIDPLFADADALDFHLQPGSPCIDRGHNDLIGADTSDLDGDANVLEPIPFDLDGLARRTDDGGVFDAGDPGAVGGPSVDLGAHERATSSDFDYASWNRTAGVFQDPRNWLGGETARANDRAGFGAGPYTVTFDTDAVTRELSVYGDVTFELGGRTYEALFFTNVDLGTFTIRDGMLRGYYSIIGSGTDVVGHMIVDGPGTRWEPWQGVNVGNGGGQGTLEITGGATVFTTQAYVGTSDGATGAILISGSTLNPWAILGVYDGSVTLEDGAQIETLQCNVDDHGALAGSGTLVMTSTIALANHGALLPGGAGTTGLLIIDGSYQQVSGPFTGALAIDIGGPGAGTGHDQLQISGSAQIGGGLVVETIGGFEPALLDSFPILTAASVTGAFDLAVVPALTGNAIMRVEYAAGAAAGGGAVMVTVDPLGEVIELAEPDSHVLPGDPAALVLADLGGGSAADIAVALRGATPSDPGSVVVFLNDGAGSFTQVGAASAIGLQPTDIDAGFLDGDANVDLVVVNSGDDSVRILLGNGDGTFDPAVTVPGAVPSPFGVAVADWSGDGLDDLAVTSSSANAVHFFRNQGAGMVAFEGAIAVGAKPGLIDPTDVDEDKNVDDLDFAIANRDAGTISMLVSRIAETGLFDFDEQVHDVGDAPLGLAVRDLDLDGTNDVVTANEGDGTLSILLATGTGSLGAATNVPLGAEEAPASVASGDLDLDGDFDLAVVMRAGDSSAQVRLLRNDLDGGAQLAFTLDPVPAIDAPQAIRVRSRDVNPATEDDIVTIHTGGGAAAGGPLGALSLFVSASLPVCPSDVDGSGAVAFDDLLAVLAAWGPCGACPEDVSGDGTVGFADLLAVLAAWGPCT